MNFIKYSEKEQIKNNLLLELNIFKEKKKIELMNIYLKEGETGLNKYKLENFNKENYLKLFNMYNNQCQLNYDKQKEYFAKKIYENIIIKFNNNQIEFSNSLLLYQVSKYNIIITINSFLENNIFIYTLFI
jgi:hypothetical protein